MKWILMFVAAVLISSFGQILLKIGAVKAGKKQVFMQWQSLLGYVIYASVVAVNMYLYRYVELSLASVLEALGYVFVMVLARLLLKEKIARNQIIGMSFILIGVVIVVYS